MKSNASTSSLSALDPAVLSSDAVSPQPLAIDVQGLGKSFKLFAKPADRLREALTGKNRHTAYQALSDVSFSVAAGEVLGVLGKNGAGKSTLLKLLTGVIMPDSGSMAINGRVTGLLELGTGFNLELSGADNITANALMLGMTHAEIEQRRNAMIEFSELGDYIHEPLRTYSSGMVMRLGFAIAIHADPACLLVDEALSVGDGYFQQKCMQRIREFKQQGGAILFVSHDLNAVKILCDRAIVLDGGKVVTQGSPEDAVNIYNHIMARQSEEEENRHLARHANVAGTHQVVVAHAQAKGELSQAEVITSGEMLYLTITLTAQEAVDDMALGLLIRDRFGQDIFGINTYERHGPIQMDKGETRTFDVAIHAVIAPGKYTVTLAMHPGKDHLDACYWWQDGALQFEVAGFIGPTFSGICELPYTLTPHSIQCEPGVSTSASKETP
ncbi:Teichoic acid export ATP-binding protein TagH [Halomonas citrativorans]|uniref:Teichoic acid export ATP-binding protein TagH n=1 Tax=Halomonas citrativorans TaxID=2742612 RepID=A0A1R4HX93_9GAMM|nr:ABC transporter ATP-binding protein [Halomonas citrativorans]SJN12187.1 Teichoic acid export ATP-binding protein TagH [Halomonas citrativorans]